MLASSLGMADSLPTQLARGAMTVDAGTGDVTIAEAFVKKSSTFRFDGIAESLRVEAVRPLTACPGCREYTLYFESRYPGYGDRTGLPIIPSRTAHRAKVVVVGESVVSGVLDEAWDIATQTILDFE
jgi:hypothetical protein